MQKLRFLNLPKTHTFQYYKKLDQKLVENETSAPRLTIWEVRSQISSCLVQQRFPKWVVCPKRPEANLAEYIEGTEYGTVRIHSTKIDMKMIPDSFLTCMECKCVGEQNMYCIIIV